MDTLRVGATPILAEYSTNLDKNFLANHYLSIAETRKFFDGEFPKCKTILTEFGMTKQ